MGDGFTGVGSVFDYRVYLVDHDGHAVAPPRILRCEDDKTAMAEALSYVDGRAIEVWKGGDRIGVIPSQDGSGGSA